MLKNYIKIAWRNLIKNKGYSLVSTLGLSFGVACCILVGLYVHHEVSYESHHEKAERIYRVGQHIEYNGNQMRSAQSPSILSQAAREQITDVQNAARLSGNPNTLVRRERVSSFEDGVYYSESAVFDLFTIPFVKGDPSTALESPGTAVISRNMAKKYFGGGDPIGESLLLTDKEITLTITGIIENPPAATDLPIHILANPGAELSWQLFSSTVTYLLLGPGEDAERIEQEILDLTKANSDVPYLKKYILDRLDRIHLHAEIGSTGDIRFIYIFSIVAFFLLLIANINHINLSIAQLMPRSREVGIRKTLGARWRQLTFQFLTETFLLSMVAILTALLLVEIVYPWVNALPGITLASFSLTNYRIWVVLIPLALFITLISGSYITFYLARLKPAAIFQKGMPQTSGGRGWLRKGLIIFQFAVSITLICSTFIAQNQLNYIMESRLGFDNEHVVILDLEGDQENRYQVLKQKIEALSGVDAVTASNGAIGTTGGFELMLEENSPLSSISLFTVGRDFISVMGIESRAGNLQDLQEGEWVINASAAEALDVSVANGQSIRRVLNLDSEEFKGKIAGIVGDFHYRSLHNEIRPLIMQIGSDAFNTLNIRLKSGTAGATLDRIRAAWNDFAPSLPMKYSFLDEQIENIYRSDQRFARIFWGFSLITIVIACMGLFGLASLAAERRTKEIGIRKVLGASVSGIVTLLGKHFVKLVSIGFVLAVPVSWYAMNQWLADFAYRIEIGPGIFALAGGAALFIALATVSWQSVRAALANPVDSLRNE